MKSLSRDIKSETLAVFALTSTAVTAGGTGDATEITGATINKATLGFRAESAVFNIPMRAVLGAAETGVLTGKVEHSSDNSNWADLVASATLLTLTGGSGGTTETGVARIGIDLNKTNQYFRIKATPDLSRASTDTAVVGAGTVSFGGLQQV